MLFMLAGCLLCGVASAQSFINEKDFHYQDTDKQLQYLQPTYLDNVYVNSPWNSNWFLSVKGGFSAFIGTPVGHGDFFDRTQPLLNVSVGKWITPYVGGRLSYQGLKLIDSDIQSRSYQNIHADLLYNISSHLRRDFEILPKWDFIAYAGCGLIRNGYNLEKPFAFSYGIIGRHRLADRLHLVGELGMTTTWQNFDGDGSPSKLGDNLLQASLGLDVTLGKVGFKRVIDAQPYITQNDILISMIDNLKFGNYKLNKQHVRDAQEVKELRKILEIEGLLDKYALDFPEQEEPNKKSPKNNYSGLNSLRERLRNKGWNGNPDTYQPKLSGRASYDPADSLSSKTLEDYFRLMKNGEIQVGSPIYFFFKLNTAVLTERSQSINIAEVAKLMKKYGLKARIDGAADSKTGTAKRNEKLSIKRAEHIASLLRKRGVDANLIETNHRGGINAFKPLEGNRNTCVTLYIK